MADYQYRASSAAGKMESGSLSAPDRKIAMAMLARRGLRVLDLKSTSASFEAVASGETVALKGGEKLALAFFRKLHQLCKGGMPVADALRSLAQRSLNPEMKALSRELYKDMSEGASLANAMGAYPRLFESSLVHLCEAGEATANLIPVFSNIISYLEGKRSLRASVRQAVAYPAVLCVLAFGVVLFFIFYLMPMIENMMASLGGEMNLPVKILVAFGDFILYGGPVILILAAAAALSLYKWRQSEQGRLASDKILLRIPLLGPVALNSDLSRFTNLVSTLYSSGVNTTETLRLAEKTIKNAFLRLQFQQCRMAINDGAPVAQSFKKFGIFDDDDVDILSVGERTGSLVEGFAEIYATHMETLESKIKTATTALTTVALSVAVLIIFLVAIGIVSSVFSVSQNLF